MSKIYMMNSGNMGCCYPRILLPAYENGFLTDRKSVADKSKPDVSQIRADIQDADLVVFHRPESQEIIDFIKMLKRDGKKIVIDNDDTFKIDDNHPLAEWTSYAHKVELQNRDKYFDEAAKLADLLTTTTPTLAKEYKQICDNVAVLPNCVDPMDWDEPLRSEGKVRIGIVGSVTYAYDYAHIRDVIVELSEREDVELVMFGLGDLEHRKKNPEVTKHFESEYDFWDSLDMEQIPWCPIEEYPTKLNEARLDIMLIPRRENYFNKCKSNIKFLEAAMCEVPVIAQSFPNSPYEELNPNIGILVKDNWREKIDELIENKALRRQIGKNAREYVLEHYNIEDNAYKWAKEYNKLIGQL